jgi:hypothetical protein
MCILNNAGKCWKRDWTKFILSVLYNGRLQPLSKQLFCFEATPPTKGQVWQLNVESKGFWRWCIKSELLGFWTLSIARNSKYEKRQRFGNWICFRVLVRRGRASLLGSWERANLSHWTFSLKYPTHAGVRGSVVSWDTMCYNLEGRVFDSLWGHWIFQSS